MVLTRRFDAKAIALQRTGRLGTFASSLGQEAVAVGPRRARCAPEDVLLPSYRETGAQLCAACSLEELLLYWGGDERGSDFAGPRRRFPGLRADRQPVPARRRRRLCHEAAARAARRGLRVRRRRDLQGRFLRGAQLRRRLALPAVFVVNNNQWAISVPRAVQTAAATLAQKAIAAGIPGRAGRRQRRDRGAPWRGGRAGARARGRRAELVEALTYRLSDHTTADDASRYRSRRGGQRALGRAIRSRACAPTWSRPASGARRTRSAWSRRSTARSMRAVERYLKTPAAAAGGDVRPSLRAAAARRWPSSARPRAASAGGDHA